MIRDRILGLRHAFHALRRTPGFLAVAVITLGLAIGANVGIFSVVRAVLLDPLPYAEPDRLVTIMASAPGSDLPDTFAPAAEFFVQYQEQASLLDGISTFNSFTNTLQLGDRIERVRMSTPTTTLFATLGAAPILGRLPEVKDANQVAVISHALWTLWFGGDPSVIGKPVRVFGRDLTVIAVMGREFWFPSEDTLLWIPQVIEPERLQPGRFDRPLVARLAPDADHEAVMAELDSLAQRLPERFGGSQRYAEMIGQHRSVVRPLGERLLGDVSAPLWILLAAAAIVLAIACANVANLFMVRAERRQADLAVRSALGAMRGRLVGAQLAEALVVACLAAGLAVLLAWLSVPLLSRAVAGDVPRLGNATIGHTSLFFTAAIAALAGLSCGLFPALRFSAPNLLQLREGTRGSTRRLRWGRSALIAAQTALAMVLLVGSALLLRSFDLLRQVAPGYDVRDVFTFQIAPEGAHLQDAPAFARFHLDFLDRLAALPGVERVGLVENVPLNEGVAGQRFRTERMGDEEDAGTLLRYTWAAGDYFETMGIEVLSGRAFERDDHLLARDHVLVSQLAAERLWPGENPIGKRLLIAGGETWETVVGVVGDVRQDDYRQAPKPMVYLPLVSQNAETQRAIASPAYVVKTARAAEIAPEIRALVREVAPTAPMYRTFTMEDLAARSMVRLSFTMLILGIVSILALALGVLGLYGVLAYSVAERTREIGLRMALGAAATRVRSMIVAQGARVMAVGILAGTIIAGVAARALGSLLYGVDALDPLLYLGVAALMAVVGLAASYLPARQASRVDPMVSLRND